MPVSYNKLWKLMIDKNLKKNYLRENANLSSSMVAKLGRNESVTVEVLSRICNALDCDIGDIVEVIKEEK